MGNRFTAIAVRGRQTEGCLRQLLTFTFRDGAVVESDVRVGGVTPRPLLVVVGVPAVVFLQTLQRVAHG